MDVFGTNDALSWEKIQTPDTDPEYLVYLSYYLLYLN